MYTTEHTHLTKELLLDHQACKSGVKFAINNKLIGMPLEIVPKITGEYKGYVNWMRMACLGMTIQMPESELTSNFNSSIKQHDARGNLIFKQSPSGSTMIAVYDNKDNLMAKKYFDAGSNVPRKHEWYEYDERSNMIRYQNALGVDHRQHFNMYDSGQLASITINNDKTRTLYIPEFKAL